MGGEELKWRQLAHHQFMSQQGLHFSPQNKDKAQISGRIICSVISDVAIASVNSRLKKLIMIIIIIVVNEKRRCRYG